MTAIKIEADAGKGLSFFYQNKVRLAGLRPGRLSDAQKALLTSHNEHNEHIAEFLHPSGQHTYLLHQQDEQSVVLSWVAGKDIFGSANGIALLFDNFPGYKEGLAFHRYGPWKAWTMPILLQAPHHAEVDEVLFYLFTYTDGTYGAMLPLANVEGKSTLGRHYERFGAKAFLKKPADKLAMMALGFHHNPYVLINQLIHCARKHLGIAPVKHDLPEVFSYLGWCTWNALGNRLSEQQVLEAAESISSVLPIHSLLLDDGWQCSGTERKLQSFEADPQKFPGGLKALKKTLKEKLGIQKLGAWHTLNGYWKGIDEAGPLFRQYPGEWLAYTDQEVWLRETVPAETFYTAGPDKQGTINFYDRWHRYLSSEGVDFVKTDNQTFAERAVPDNMSAAEWGKLLQEALNASVHRNFNGAVIHCMGMSPELYFYHTAGVARCSEDYFPYTEGESYHLHSGNAAAHVVNCFYNALWFSRFALPDFDMFESSHPDAAFHAIARAMSGGPVYLTDAPHTHRPEHIWPLIDARGKIIAVPTPGLPTRSSLFLLQQAGLFKVFSHPRKYAGLLAVWNVCDCDWVSGTLLPNEIEDIEGETFAVYEYFSQKLIVLKKDESLHLNFGRKQCAYYNVHAVIQGFAPIGLSNKYNAILTIAHVGGSISDNISLILTEPGNFVAYSEHRPAQVLSDTNQNLPFTYHKGQLNIDHCSKNFTIHY